METCPAKDCYWVLVGFSLSIGNIWAELALATPSVSMGNMGKYGHAMGKYGEIWGNMGKDGQ
eukprot:7383064-Prymnesium_polylepis.1